MTLNIVQKLRELPVHDAARLIGCAPQYISDSNFINLLNQYNLNIDKKDKNDKNNKKGAHNDAILAQQFNMFASIPGLKEQVSRWLSS